MKFCVPFTSFLYVVAGTLFFVFCGCDFFYSPSSPPLDISISSTDSEIISLIPVDLSTVDSSQTCEVDSLVRIDSLPFSDTPPALFLPTQTDTSLTPCVCRDSEPVSLDTFKEVFIGISLVDSILPPAHANTPAVMSALDVATWFVQQFSWASSVTFDSVAKTSVQKFWESLVLGSFRVFDAYPFVDHAQAHFASPLASVPAHFYTDSCVLDDAVFRWVFSQYADTFSSYILNQNVSASTKIPKRITRAIWALTHAMYAPDSNRVVCEAMLQNISDDLVKIPFRVAKHYRPFYEVVYEISMYLHVRPSVSFLVRFSNVLAADVDLKRLPVTNKHPQQYEPRYRNANYVALQRMICQYASPQEAKAKYYAGLELYYARLRQNDILGALITLHYATVEVNNSYIDSWTRELLNLQLGKDTGFQIYRRYLQIAYTTYDNPQHTNKELYKSYLRMSADFFIEKKKYKQAIHCLENLDPDENQTSIQYEIRKLKSLCQ